MALGERVAPRFFLLSFLKPGKTVLLGRRARWLLLTFSVLLSWPHEANATWQQVYNFGTSFRGTCGYFFNRYVGVIGLGTATSTPIVRTTDGGATWIPCSTPATTGYVWVSEITFVNQVEGWATYFYSTSASNVWHTSDGGVTWQPALYATNAVCVRKTSHALVVTQYTSSNAGISVSTNGGLSFTNAFSNNQNGIDFSDDLHGVVAGFGSNFFFSGDGGVSWLPSQTSFIHEAWGVAAQKGTGVFLCVPEGFFFGGQPVFKSVDYGANWSIATRLPFYSSGDMQCSGNAFYIQAQGGTANGLYRSTDQGLNWTSIGGPNNGADSRFVLTECGNVIYAFDANGGVWRSTDAGDGVALGPCALGRNDTLRTLGATLCDSVKRTYFLHNPLGDTAFVSDIRITDSIGGAYAAKALTIDSLPGLQYRLRPADSMGFTLGWKPLRTLDSIGEDRVTVRVVYYNPRFRFYDTIYLPLKLQATSSAPRFALDANTLKYDSVASCSPVDTVITLFNDGCYTMWLTKALMTKHGDWLLTDSAGAPIQLPIALDVGASTKFFLRFSAHSSKTLLDTLRLSMHQLGRDTSTIIKLTSRGRLIDAAATSETIQFDSLPTCAFTDTLFSISNVGCDTLMLTQAELQSLDWSILDSTGAALRLPLRIPQGESRKVLLHFKPSSLGGHIARLGLHYRYQQFDTTHNVLLSGSGKATGALTYAKSFDFGPVSICASSGFDSILTFSNSSCDSVLLDSLSIDSGFQLLDSASLPLWVGSGKTVGLRVRYVASSKKATTGDATIKYFINNTIVHDTIHVQGTGVSGTSVYAQSPAVDSIGYPGRTECDRLDSTTFTVLNPGCDTLRVLAAAFDGNLPAILKFNSDDALPAVIPDGDSLHFSVRMDTLIAGTYDGHLRLTLQDADGRTHDTLIAFHTTITAGSRALSLTSSSMDFGTLSPCSIYDTVVVYQNTGCLPVTINERSVSGFGFDLQKRGVDPIVLQPGERDTLRLTSTNVHGPISGHLVVTANTDLGGTYAFDVAGTISPLDSIGWIMSISKDPIPSGDIATLSVHCDRVVSSHGLHSIKGELVLDQNAFTVVKVVSPTGYGFTLSPAQIVGPIEHLPFELSSGSEISLDPATPLLVATLHRFVADSVDVHIGLKNVLLNDIDPSYSKCILTTAPSEAAAVESHLSRQCDDLLITDLRGSPLVLVDQIVPNPIDRASGYKASVRLHAKASATVIIDFTDMEGRTLSRSNVSLEAGEERSVTFDLAGEPSGTYYFSVTAGGTRAVRGSMTVMK